MYSKAQHPYHFIPCCSTCHHHYGVAIEVLKFWSLKNYYKDFSFSNLLSYLHITLTSEKVPYKTKRLYPFFSVWDTLYKLPDLFCLCKHNTREVPCSDLAIQLIWGICKTLIHSNLWKSHSLALLCYANFFWSTSWIPEVLF